MTMGEGAAAKTFYDTPTPPETYRGSFKTYRKTYFAAGETYRETKQKWFKLLARWKLARIDERNEEKSSRKDSRKKAEPRIERNAHAAFIAPFLAPPKTDQLRV
jgi:hypothetical protein